MILFFGDSITEGTNCTRSFVDFLDERLDIYNFGVSGTTIGEYSIYPVDGNSLTKLYPTAMYLPVADTLVFEYGINDVSSIMCGFTTLEVAIISFVRALDGIDQLNPLAKKIFLSISDDKEIIFEYAKRQCHYLSTDYFRGFDFIFPASKWADTYNELIKGIGKKIEVVPMINNVDFLKNKLTYDNIHPNEYGHKIIAENIQMYI